MKVVEASFSCDLERET